MSPHHRLDTSPKAWSVPPMCNLDSLRKGPQAILDLASLLAHLFEIYGQPLTTFGGVVTRIDFAYRGGRRDQAMWSHQ